MRTKTLVGVALLVAAGAACDARDPTGPSAMLSVDAPLESRGAVHPVRQISGTIAGTDEYGTACGEGEGIWLTSTAGGILTHLGRTTMVSTLCLSLSDYSIIGPAPYTLTAANGDEIGGMITGVVYTAYGFDMYTSVTGGTGRFEGVSGELVWPTVSDGSGIWTAGVEGWIRY